MKLLEDNKREKVCELRLGKDFLVIIPKTQSLREMQIKTTCHYKYD